MSNRSIHLVVDNFGLAVVLLSMLLTLAVCLAIMMRKKQADEQEAQADERPPLEIIRRRGRHGTTSASARSQVRTDPGNIFREQSDPNRL